MIVISTWSIFPSMKISSSEKNGLCLASLFKYLNKVILTAGKKKIAKSKFLETRFCDCLTYCRLHYMASTNAGFCQGNMTWCFKVRGPDYHWVVDLYERLKLPVVPAVVGALHKATTDRAAELEKQKSERRKQNRIRMKVARAEDQESRKKWVKQQAVRHSYGCEDSGDEDEEEVDAHLEREVSQIVGSNEQITVISGRKCRCGSTEHSRVTHRSCPLNNKEK